MANNTTNHSFPVDHEPGDDWDYDPTFEYIESKLIIRDEFAAIDDYRPYEDALFWATDTGGVYEHNGFGGWSRVNPEFNEVRLAAVTGPVTTTAIEDFEGDNLSVDTEGRLNAASGSGGTNETVVQMHARRRLTSDHS